MEKYDVAVIGGGPGGYVAAIRAAQRGKRVCLIEKDKLGGVCLNEGCIPTKTWLKSIEILDAVRKCEAYGISGVATGSAALDLEALQRRKRTIVGQLTGGVEALLRGNGITLYSGQARLVTDRSLEVQGEEIGAANIIIATGSQPLTLPIPMTGGAGGGKAPVITSTEALELTAVPATLTIIGGGVIGIEFAYVFAKLGTKVTVLEMMDRILPPVDEEIAAAVTAQLRSIGVEIFTSARVSRIVGASVHFEQSDSMRLVEAEKILMAVGRTPRTNGLGVEALGIELNGAAIGVDEHLETTVRGIYAIGDVNGISMLAHTASMEAVVAVENILGRQLRMDYSLIPSAIYLQPEVASVGLTERQAREKFGTVRVGRFPLAANGKAIIEGETGGWVKVIVEPEFHEIIGIHIRAPHATDLIAEGVLAMKLEATAEEVAGTVHPHPTVAEIIPEAFHAALGKAIHAR